MPKLSELPAAVSGQPLNLVSVEGPEAGVYTDVLVPLASALANVSGTLDVNLSNIDLGTLGVKYGGTGNSATPGSGALLIGNGSGFALTTLTAGSNITITNGAGSVTIASTGGGTVTEIIAASPLTGGTITTSGTIGFESIPSGEIIGNSAGTSAVPGPVQVTTILDMVFGSAEGDLLVRGAAGWTTIAAGASADVLTSQGALALPVWAAAPASEWSAGTVSTLSSDFSLSSGTLALTDSLVSIAANEYVFSNGTTIEGVAASGAVDLIFQGGATVATGEYVLETALPFPITINDAKTWISGTSPSASGVAVQVIHAGTTTAVGGLTALSITAGTPNAPTTTAASSPNTAVAGDTLQINIGSVSGTITALGLHLDFVRTG